MEWWNGLLEWSTGLDYWRGVVTHAQNCRLSLARASWGLERFFFKCMYLLESAMDRDSTMPLGTENDPIVILDSSPGYHGNTKQLRSPVKILDGDQYRYSQMLLSLPSLQVIIMCARYLLTLEI